MESRFRRYKGAMPTPHAWLSSFVVLLAAASAHGDAAKSRVALDMAQQLVDPYRDLVTEGGGNRVLPVGAPRDRHVGTTLGEIGHCAERLADQA